MTYTTKNSRKEGGRRWVIGDGGELDIETGGALKLEGVQVTASAAEINLAATGGWASFTTATTPAAGSCAVQLVFKDAAGVTMAAPVTGRFYLSENATGLTIDPADTGIAVLTNGAVQALDAASQTGWQFVTTAAGLLGVTITAAADSYWLVFKGPGGLLKISDECVVNA